MTEGRPLYPYWPVCFSVLDLAPAPKEPQDNDYMSASRLFAPHRPRSSKSISHAASTIFHQGRLSPVRPSDWWQHAIQLSSDLGTARRWAGSANLWRMKLEQARAKGGKGLADAGQRREARGGTHQERPAFGLCCRGC